MAALKKDPTPTPRAMAAREGSREMYRLFLECEYEEALVVARSILHALPDDPIALVIEMECAAALKKLGVELPQTMHVIESEPPSGVSLVGERTVSHAEESTRIWDTEAPLSSRRSTLYELFLHGEFAEALVIAEEVLAHAKDDAMARAIASECRAALRRTDSVPVLTCSMDAVAASDIGPRAAFVLSRVDGVATVEAITDMSGMTESETMAVLEQLIAKGILRLDPPAR